MVPLVVPEINGNLVTSENKIYAVPNCSTTILVMLLAPLLKIVNTKILRVTLSTYQAASGAGIIGYNELVLQTDEISKNIELTQTFWKKQYIHNIFSHNSDIDLVTLFNKEELKIVNETKKILNYDIKISPTCVRVPVLRSHCISVNVEFDCVVSKEQILDVLMHFPGVNIEDDPIENEFPEPIKTTKTTAILIGRIRSDIDDKTRWNFFISGDQLLKGAAYNSIQILELCMQN
jgi:aspartate-semialdehyde dehydrogenase